LSQFSIIMSAFLKIERHPVSFTYDFLKP
jgi:hypothetical protein